MSRDMTVSEFESALKRYGFVRLGFLGYVNLAPPCASTSVSIYNAGKNRRAQLAYLLRKQAEAEAERKAKRMTATQKQILLKLSTGLRLIRSDYVTSYEWRDKDNRIIKGESRVNAMTVHKMTQGGLLEVRFAAGDSVSRYMPTAFALAALEEITA